MPLVQRRPGSEAWIPAIAGAIVAAFFSFGGWWEASKIAGELRNPKRTLPFAFIGGVALVTLVYLLISAAFLAVLPIDRISSNTAFVAQFGEVLFGSAGAKVLSLCVLVCVFGGIAALTMASPRVTYAMARSGAFFPSFGKLHPRLGTPVNAILLQTGLSLAVLLLGAFDRVLAFIIFSAVCFLALTASTLFRMREPVRGWWFPAAPVIFIAFCIIVGLLILLHDPLPALIGVVTVLCGLPLYQFLTARQLEAPPTDERN
jgi:APA family basic amino acid/polyamine antiporter